MRRAAQLRGVCPTAREGVVRRVACPPPQPVFLSAYVLGQVDSIASVTIRGRLARSRKPPIFSPPIYFARPLRLATKSASLGRAFV